MASALAALTVTTGEPLLWCVELHWNYTCKGHRIWQSCGLTCHSAVVDQQQSPQAGSCRGQSPMNLLTGAAHTGLSMLGVSSTPRSLILRTAEFRASAQHLICSSLQTAPRGITPPGASQSAGRSQQGRCRDQGRTARPCALGLQARMEGPPGAAGRRRPFLAPNCFLHNPPAAARLQMLEASFLQE